MTRTAALAPLVTALLLAAPALANSHDPDLSRMVLDRSGNPWDGTDPYNSLFRDADQKHPRPNQAFFRKLAADVGLAFAPTFLAPAETLGHDGFDVALEWQITGIDRDAPYWAGPCGGHASEDCKAGSYVRGDGKPGSTLTAAQLHVRKGLPMSFEIGGTVSYMLFTEMLAIGMELRWAPLEGFFKLPDIALRGSVNRVVNSGGLDLTMGGFDVSISKSFGVLGSADIAPYAGYSLLYLRAASQAFDATPDIAPGATALSPDAIPPGYAGTLADWRRELASGSIDAAQTEEYTRAMRQHEDRMVFAFDAESMIAHREFIGLRFKAHVLEFAAEVVFAEVPVAELDFTWQFGARVGFDF